MEDDSLRQRYWSMLCYKKYTYNYYWNYRNRKQNFYFFLKLFTTLTASAGVAGWLIWAKVPFFWAIIVGISQAILAVDHLIPWKEQITKIDYFLPALAKLNNKIVRTWESIDSLENSDIANYLYNYLDEYLDLEQYYLGFTSFPHDQKSVAHAEDELKRFIDYYYTNSEEGVN